MINWLDSQKLKSIIMQQKGPPTSRCPYHDGLFWKNPNFNIRVENCLFFLKIGCLWTVVHQLACAYCSVSAYDIN